jgi:hydrogenase expression/formation protein HypE
MRPSLPVGKLPPELLVGFLQQAPILDPRVFLGPGIGLDCAVIDYGSRYLVFKSDPITFATDQIGWYAVQINANDIVTCGAVPRWMLLTILLPEGKTSTELVEQIFAQVYDACSQYNISVIGGHTEITSDLDRVILVATMVGEVEPDKLVTPRGAQPGNAVLLTKGVPIEATALVARECSELLRVKFTPDELELAKNFLYEPGISVLEDARIALSAGGVTAMHDPTEGGLAAALWELAEASQVSVVVNADAIPVPDISGRICQLLDIDPLEAIASGALLLTVHADRAVIVQAALENAGIRCAHIGEITHPPVGVFQSSAGVRKLMQRPERDAIAKLFE